MKAYTVNNHLVGVGNDQILGTDQGGTTYTAGAGIDITNDVISIDDTVALASALPTTEVGKFTIQSNVSGGPIEVLIPTDQAADAVFYQIDSVTGNAYSITTSNAVINYYYGETPADFNGSDDSILFTINDNISNIGSISFYYTQSETSYGGPSLTTTSINGNSTTGILQSGTYKLKAQYNQAGTSSPYGKYLQIMFNWRNYASDYAQSLQWAQEALSKITFFGVVRPDPTLGVTVNLDRYYLGNAVNSSTLSSELACQVTVDSTTKQQTVYLPGYIPSSWKQDVNVLLPYGTTSNPNLALYTYYGAYKQESGTSNMQYAVCVDHNWTNKIMTFIAFDKNGNAFEKWTYNWGISPKTWTTETISPDMSEYISYSASGVYLPNSKFEIDTEGQAYKVISESSETAFNSFDDGGICFTYYNSQAGTTYKAILPSNIDHIGISNDRGWNVTGTFDVATHTATLNVNAVYQGYATYVYAYDSNGTPVPLFSTNTTVKRITPAVTEEYLTDGDLELNGDNQVTAIDGHALAVPAAQVNSDWNANSGVAEILNKPTEIQLIAGANVQVEVTGASAIISAQGGGGGGGYATETYVQNYVQNYTIPVEVVANAAAATGTNILYVVTGS